MNYIYLGSILSKYIENTYQKNTKDHGSMHIVGNGMKGDGSIGTYKLTQNLLVEKAINEIEKTAELYY